MLAQNFMSAEALGVTKEAREALIKTLRFLESDKPAFDMALWSGGPARLRDPHHCRSAQCIGGWCASLTGVTPYHGASEGSNVGHLLYPAEPGAYDVTDVAKGIAALRNFLTIGDPQWKVVMAEARA